MIPRDSHEELAIDSSSKCSIFWLGWLMSIWHIDQFIVFIHNDIVLRSNHESIRLGVLVCMPQHQRRVTCSMPHRPQLAVDLMSGGPIEQINYVRYVIKFASSRGCSKFLLASRHAEDFVRMYPHQSMMNPYAHRLQYACFNSSFNGKVCRSGNSPRYGYVIYFHFLACQ